MPLTNLYVQLTMLSQTISSKSLKITCLYTACTEHKCAISLFTTDVQAGFPSPADDYIEQALDLNELVVQRPSATFYVRVQGDSMQYANITSGDILVVDRSLTANNKSIVVAILDGEFTVKRLMIENDQVYLAAENPEYAAIAISKESQFQVWGVVTYVIHKAK